MSHFAETRVRSGPPWIGNPRGPVGWLCTNNPFYVISAGLFLAGLWISFGRQVREIETWSLMSGLAGYTLLLAVTACLLVRFARVWDDVRTVLLLVVLMFLATSVTFDEVLALDPGRGLVCYVLGLLFAVAVSEGVIRGMRLGLPVWFRVPYYLILTLFFVYPLALAPLLSQPQSELLLWGLFGFSPVAGLVFLTLLPAIRRGPGYVRYNGSPWRWPLYPWTLFGLLALAVPARAVLLCWSMHLVNAGQFNRIIFGPYFLVPFGMVLIVLFLEIGLVGGHRTALTVALAAPVALIGLTLLHRGDPLYDDFLEKFMNRLGAAPLYLTTIACVGFYAYAALRRVPFGIEALTLALAGLAVIGTRTLFLTDLVAPRPAPILSAALLQLGLGTWRREAWRCLLGAGVMAVALAATLPEAATPSPFRPLIVFHLVLITMLAVGAMSDDAVGWLLRGVGGCGVLLACLAATFANFDHPDGFPSWSVQLYPPVMATMLTVYGLLLSHRPSLALAAVALAGWLAVAGGRGYVALRQLVTGLDYLALSLAVFAVAILISLGKSGLLGRRLSRDEGEVPGSTA
jgi:hypothetical protein